LLKKLEEVKQVNEEVRATLLLNSNAKEPSDLGNESNQVKDKKSNANENASQSVGDKPADVELLIQRL